MYANQAILVRVTASRRVEGQYEIGVSGPTYPTLSAPYSRYVTAPFSLPSSEELTAEVLASAIYGDPNPAGRHLVRLLLEYPFRFVLLDLRAARLYAAPWEAITTIPPFNVPANNHRVIRYSPGIADLALTPLNMPVDTLLAELTSWPVSDGELIPHALKHFRLISATRVDGERFQALVRSATFDVVHVRARAVRDGDGVALEAGSDLLRAPTLRSLLARGKRAARLIIFETDATSIRAVFDIAHHIHGHSGPTVLVAESGRFDFNEFYYDITHNQWLSLAFAARQSNITGPPLRAALLMARGGDEMLQISRAQLAISTRAETELIRIGGVIEAIEERRPFLRDPSELTRISDQLDQLHVASERIREIRNMVYSYDQESRGMEPMTTAAGDLAHAVAGLATKDAPVARVVNTWFSRDESQAVPRTASLVGGTPYQLNVMVGPPSRSSNIRLPMALPEGQLAAYYTGDGLPVRVVLFSSDFELIDRETELKLPRPPAASDPVVLNVIAPVRGDSGHLRVNLYYQNNLLQSIMITAAVAAAEVAGDGRGNSGEVEWALSDSLRDIDRFEQKAVNFVLNQTPGGTHLIGVVGTGFRQQFSFGETELHDRIENARGALQWICGDPTKGQKYRFEPANRGSKGNFREHMSGLAEFGYDLYDQLLSSQDDAFEAKLSKALIKPTTLQAAAMKSAKYVFPWALVYDRPIVPHPTNQVCPDFMKLLDGGATAAQLANSQCFVLGCAHHGNVNVVCPSGFWGFRHVVEQPLAIAQAPEPDHVAPRASRDGDPVDVINVSGTAQMLMGYSENLKEYKEHRTEVQAFTQAQTDPQSDLFEIGKGLQRVDLHCVYFYCHGGHKGSKAWLGVGANPADLLYPSNLRAWKVGWPTIRPFVFINGCDTVGMTPSDLMTFREALTRCKASGVLGSEITTPETLGREFGRRFLEGLLDGQNVGEVVRRLRLELLAGYNPLGLAYTPYCLSKLRMAFQSQSGALGIH